MQAPPGGRSRSEADFRSNDLLATRESARGAVSHLLSLFLFAKNKSGERTPWADQLRR